MSSCEEKLECVEGEVAGSAGVVPSDLSQFLLDCERDFGKRYTEEDEEFASLLHARPPTPPIVCPWYSRPPNYSQRRDGGRRNYRQNMYDHRNNYSSRNHYGERSAPYHRNDHGRRDHRDGQYGNRYYTR